MMISNGSGIKLWFQLLTPILFISPSAFAYDFWEHVWLEGDLSGGFQRLNTDLQTEVSKNGGFINGRILGEYRHEEFGFLGIAIGGQQTWQSGSTTAREQDFIQRGPTLDISYFYPVIPEFLSIGVLSRNLMGAGAQFDFSNTTHFENLSMLGPQARFTHKWHDIDWVAGISFLYSLNGRSRSIFEIPVFVGLTIPLSGTIASSGSSSETSHEASGETSRDASPGVSLEFTPEPSPPHSTEQTQPSAPASNPAPAAESEKGN